ncbi:hypothetical protein QL093DRAFT_2235817 [Fusarium oxysporum]|nr:hypothetical protein QL093DRAFT_2235817 [Fusarium oxysporum]
MYNNSAMRPEAQRSTDAAPMLIAQHRLVERDSLAPLHSSRQASRPSPLRTMMTA